jgi:hypothetical protein
MRPLKLRAVVEVHLRAKFANGARVCRAVGRGDLGRELAGFEFVMREQWGARVAVPYLAFTQISQSNFIGSNQPRLPAELRGHVAKGHALLHRQGTDRRPAILHGLVLAAVHAEAPDEEEHDVLRRDAGTQPAVEVHGDGVRHLQPDLAGHHHAEHLGRADAEHVGREGTPGGGMAVAADREHAGPEMAALGEHHVADALRVVEGADPGFLHPVARDLDDPAAFVIVRRQVVIGDHDDLGRIPYLCAEALEAWLQPARAARVVDHRKVDLAGDDLARGDVLAAAGAGHELLGEGARHQIPR